MGKYSYYDKKENIIFTDITGVPSKKEVTDEVINEVIELAKNLPQRPYVVVCWKDVKMDAEVAAYYGERVADLLKNYVRGIARYSATDVTTRINIRAETVKHHTQRSRSHLYNSKEEAIEAVRKGEIG